LREPGQLHAAAVDPLPAHGPLRGAGPGGGARGGLGRPDRAARAAARVRRLPAGALRDAPPREHLLHARGRGRRARSPAAGRADGAPGPPRPLAGPPPPGRPPPPPPPPAGGGPPRRRPPRPHRPPPPAPRRAP